MQKCPKNDFNFFCNVKNPIIASEKIAVKEPITLCGALTEVGGVDDVGVSRAQRRCLGLFKGKKTKIDNVILE